MDGVLEVEGLGAEGLGVPPVLHAVRGRIVQRDSTRTKAKIFFISATPFLNFDFTYHRLGGLPASGSVSGPVSLLEV